MTLKTSLKSDGGVPNNLPVAGSSFSQEGNAFPSAPVAFRVDPGGIDTAGVEKGTPGFAVTRGATAWDAYVVDTLLSRL